MCKKKYYSLLKLQHGMVIGVDLLLLMPDYLHHMLAGTNHRRCATNKPAYQYLYNLAGCQANDC